MSFRSRFVSTAALVSTCFATALVAAACGGSGDSSSDGTPSDGTSAGGTKAGSGGSAGSKATGGSSGAKSTGGSSGSSGSAGAKSTGGASGSGGSHAGSAGANAGGTAGSSNGGSGGSSNGGTAGKGGSSSTGGKGGTSDGGSSSSLGGSAGTGGSNGGCTSPVALQITPSPVQIDVTNGVAAPVTLQAIGICSDNTTAPVAASWSFDRADLAIIGTGSGVLTANGQKGGQGTATATFGSLPSAQTDVTITLHFQPDPGGVSMGDQTTLGNGGGTATADTLLYPYDQTVFARGILAPELMWSGGAAGDEFLVQITEKYAQINAFAKIDPPGRLQIDAATWDALTVTNGGEDVTVAVTRLESNGTLHAPMKEAWKIAQGSLRGSIYYWAVNQGQIVKIAPGASAPNVVFDSGAATDMGSPAPVANYDPSYGGEGTPWQPNDEGKRCVACHTVARNGTRLSSVFSRGAPGSTGPWGAIDLTSGNISVIGDYAQNVDFEALTPDGSKIVANTTDMKIHLADATNGSSIGSFLDSLGDLQCDPAFSNDTTKLAFAGSVQGYYPVEFYASNLDLLDFDGSGTFSNRRTLVPGNGAAIAFPSFSPGSDLVVYQKGDYSRAKYGSNQHGSDDLYLADVAGQLGEVNLAIASGANLEPRNQHLAYQPTVNPVAVGGYFWVVFVSPRDYGNRMLSASDPTYENHKQLWVAAVDLNPTPGTDPSHPAFLLVGQDPTTTNMSGYWSLEACQQNGNNCSEGYECCSGFCREQSNGTFSCVDAPPNACSNVGEKCGSTADCCDAAKGVTCVGGICSEPKPLPTQRPRRVAQVTFSNHENRHGVKSPCLASRREASLRAHAEHSSSLGWPSSRFFLDRGGLRKQQQQRRRSPDHGRWRGFVGGWHWR